MNLILRSVPSVAEIKQHQCGDCRKYACDDLKSTCVQLSDPSYHKNIFELADGYAFNAGLDSGRMDHLAVADV